MNLCFYYHQLLLYMYLVLVIQTKQNLDTKSEENSINFMLLGERKRIALGHLCQFVN
jgi:hypothetical protein